jgi:hypothetical protein
MSGVVFHDDTQGVGYGLVVGARNPSPMKRYGEQAFTIIEVHLVQEAVCK